LLLVAKWRLQLWLCDPQRARFLQTHRHDELCPTQNLKVLLLHETEQDVERLAQALMRDGDEVRSIRANALTMAAEIEAWPPDVLLIAADDPSRDMVEQICVASANRERPIVMFTEADDPEAMRTLVKSGVSAYVVAGCAPARLRSVINVALERFEHEQLQYLAVRTAATKQEDERAIGRAKAYLQRTGLSEADAYAQLRRQAMQERRTIAEVARRVVGASSV
jgi:two-component system, response regulator / RNA-binding antiterminator